MMSKPLGMWLINIAFSLLHLRPMALCLQPTMILVFDWLPMVQGLYDLYGNAVVVLPCCRACLACLALLALLALPCLPCLACLACTACLACLACLAHEEA